MSTLRSKNLNHTNDPGRHTLELYSNINPDALVVHGFVNPQRTNTRDLCATVLGALSIFSNGCASNPTSPENPDKTKQAENKNDDGPSRFHVNAEVAGREVILHGRGDDRGLKRNDFVEGETSASATFDAVGSDESGIRVYVGATGEAIVRSGRDSAFEREHPENTASDTMPIPPDRTIATGAAVLGVAAIGETSSLRVEVKPGWTSYETRNVHTSPDPRADMPSLGAKLKGSLNLTGNLGLGAELEGQAADRAKGTDVSYLTGKAAIGPTFRVDNFSVSLQGTADHTDTTTNDRKSGERTREGGSWFGAKFVIEFANRFKLWFGGSASDNFEIERKTPTSETSYKAGGVKVEVGLEGKF